MFNDFLVSIGLKKPTVEIWQCRELVIVDEDGQIIWCRPGVIEYKSMPEQYWGGQAGIYDVGTEAPRFLLTLDRIAHRDENSLLIPMFGRQTGRRGAKIAGRDAEGHPVTLYIGQHALSYIAAHGLVENMPPLPPLDGPEAGFE